MDVWAGVAKKHDSQRSIICVDKTGTITSCNEAARILFGYPLLHALIGSNVGVLMAPSVAAVHQSYIDRYLASGVSHGAFGEWKVRQAIRCDGRSLQVRVALSFLRHDSAPVFSALIEPVYECTLCTDKDGTIVSASGAPWLLFGRFNESLVGQSILVVVARGADWAVANEGRIVLCKNADGDEFSVMLKTSKQGSRMVGEFSPAPPMRAKLIVQPSGIISDCSGETMGLLGYTASKLKGKAIDAFLDKEAGALPLNCKTLISLRRRDGRKLWISLRVTPFKPTSGITLYKCLLKAKESGTKSKYIARGSELRYGGSVLGWYELGPSLGHGLCGPVRRAVHRLTGVEVAIKMLVRARHQELHMEYPPPKLQLLEKVRHPNIVRLFDSIWTQDVIYVVLELVDGGEFFEYCAAAGPLSEDSARIFWRQIVSAVDYLHQRHICHRDIKLENIMLDANNHIKLVDFGFACSFKDNEPLQVFCGSPDYAAPELIAAEPYFGPSIDVWALGVVLYVMLTGYIPFLSAQKLQIISWAWPPNMHPSQSVHVLLLSIFRPTENRITTTAIVAHEWTRMEELEPSLDASSLLDDDILETMEKSFGWSRVVTTNALASHPASSQVVTTYCLLEHKKRMATASTSKVVPWSSGTPSSNESKGSSATCVLN